MAVNKTTNLKAYKRKWHVNVGLITFGAIFIYLAVTVIMYLTNPKVSIYEVREGSILRDTAYTGVIIREEKVVKSEKSGYVNLLAPEFLAPYLDNALLALAIKIESDSAKFILSP